MKTFNSLYNKSYIKCPVCGEIVEVETDMCLTTLPPMYGYHCTICDHHGTIYCHELKDLQVMSSEQTVAAPCLICGEDVIVAPSHHGSVVCDNCKQAILKLRKMLESKE